MKIGALALLLLGSAVLSAQTVRFSTNMGDIDVNLLPNDAPLTVANFLRYVNRGSYNGSFFHRSVPGFIVQGGGFTWTNNAPVAIPSDPPVRNEYKVSNARGTIAMAKLGNDPNSATNQWFFNLANNASNLNNQNGGFTVFGRVANNESLAVMDRIAGVPVYNAGSGTAFEQLPLQNYRGGNVTPANLVVVNSITVIGQPSVAGVVSASAFGAYTEAAPGSYVEIYGTNLAATTREWASGDFTEGRAPTSIEGVSVTVGGQPAFIRFVSPTQLNIQLPENVSGSAPVVVTVNGQASAPVPLNTKPFVGGLLAPVSFKTGDRQFVAAIHSDGSFVNNGQVQGLTAAPARPGETLLFYGTGFGAVTGGTPFAGQTATGSTTLAQAVEFLIGGMAAQVSYSGLAPNFVGLYQFNVTVPQNVAGGDARVEVRVGGEPIGQTLWLPIRTE